MIAINYRRQGSFHSVGNRFCSDFIITIQELDGSPVFSFLCNTKVYLSLGSTLIVLSSVIWRESLEHEKRLWRREILKRHECYLNVLDLESLMLQLWNTLDGILALTGGTCDAVFK